jgi:sugar/nucleoside kinase (ribokinase family)
MDNKKIKVSGTGCALVDYVYVNADFNSLAFRKYTSQLVGDGGLSPGKLVFVDELEKFANKSYSEILREINSEDFDNFNVGGPSLVSLIHAAQVLPKSNFDVQFYGCAGKDAAADLISYLLEKTSLDFSNYHKSSNKPTPFTHVISDKNYADGQGERTFVNNIGAALDYAPNLLPDSFFESDIVCFGGTALVPPIHDNLSQLLTKSKKRNCITIVNTVFDFRSEKSRPHQAWKLVENDESFGLIDILLMDCEEALKISGTKDLKDASAYFAASGVSSFFITNGVKEVIAFSNGNLFEKMEIEHFPVSRKIVDELHENPHLKGDTTGCGDNFAGGVIASVATQLQTVEFGYFCLKNALSWGVVAGGFACFYVGGTYHENCEREKIARLKSYQSDYLQQISGQIICL